MKKIFWVPIILGIIIIILAGILLMPKTAKSPQQPIVEGIKIVSPVVNEEISSPFKITGVASGNGWSGFEGQVGTVRLLDSGNRELAKAVLVATTDWTKFPTSFEVTLNFKPVVSGEGSLVFRNENPSGSPEKDKTFTLPVKLK